MRKNKEKVTRIQQESYVKSKVICFVRIYLYVPKFYAIFKLENYFRCARLKKNNS